MIDLDEVRQALAGHSCRAMALGTLRPAAVLLPLFFKGGEPHLLFTRRTETMPHHRGEISFPGGVYEEEDGGLMETALRETEEEMGIAVQDVELLGQLDDFLSIHGYRVTPFVGHYPHPYNYRVNGDEIAEVLEIPLAVFTDPSIFRQEDWRHRGRVHPVYFYTVGEHEVWGLTAAILRQFLERLGPLVDRMAG